MLLANGYSWETVKDCEAEMSIDSNRQKKHSDLHCVINKNLAICGSSILYRDVCDLTEVPHASYRLAIQYVSCQGRTSCCLRFVIRLWDRSPSGHCWAYYPGTFSPLWSHCNSFEYWALIEEIYSVFKWAWPKLRLSQQHDILYWLELEYYMIYSQEWS